MRLLLLFIVAFVFSAKVLGQQFDNTWMMGYEQDFIPNNFYGINLIKFDNGVISISDNTTADLEFWHNNASFSDSSGQLLTYCNGLQIGNRQFSTMDNGADLDVEIYNTGIEDQYYSSENLPQGCMFLPWPDHSDSLLLIYSGTGYIPIAGFTTTNRNLSYAVIDKKSNNGLGKVIAREQPILEDTLAWGQVTTVKHANGRDWWVLYPEFNSRKVYRMLVNQTGIQQYEPQIIEDSIIQGLGQSCFSPDGTKFACYNAISATAGAWLDIFDFDRCEGLLSNQHHIYYEPGIGRIGGVAFSPNSRFLYHNFFDTVYQYDLHATDLMVGRKVVGIRENSIYGTRFYQAQLAPDGKIYSSATNGSIFLHVIHYPDEEGEACGFVQRGIRLKNVNAFSVPNHPNYRLGPLDGSACDTLGIDNHPVAWWRYEQDTLNANHLTFHDLSWYEPTSWAWDFGDGYTSTERHPEHTFPLPGTYQVCLTVSNVNSSNTHCQTIYGVTNQENPVVQAQIQLTPNPFHTQLTLTLSATLRSPVFRLYDLYGREVRQERVQFGVNTISTEGIVPGMYFWTVEAGGEVVKKGKAICAF